LLDAPRDRHPALAWPAGEIRRYRGVLHLLARDVSVPAPDGGAELPARAGAQVALGGHAGSLRLVRARGRGLAPAKIGPVLTIRYRTGGEQIRPVGAAHHRELKKLLQERGVVPWMRERVPLVFAGETLVAVADLWIAAEFAVRADETGLRLRWEAHPRID
jgi:tRNA(Ile)-lysidine synthase